MLLFKNTYVSIWKVKDHLHISEAFLLGKQISFDSSRVSLEIMHVLIYFIFFLQI